MLKAVADRYVMSRDDATRRYADQQAIVQELAAALLRDAPRGLDPLLADDFAAATDDAGPAPGGRRPGGPAHRRVRRRACTPA